MKKLFVLAFVLFCCMAYPGEFKDIACYAMEFETLCHVMEDEEQEHSCADITFSTILQELLSENKN